MKLTTEELQELTRYVATHYVGHYDDSVINTYAPKLFRELLCTNLSLIGLNLHAGIYPAFAWPDTFIEFLTEALHRQYKMETITTEHVLLGGLLLQFMHARGFADYNTKIKLLRALSLQKNVALFDLHNFEFNSQIQQESIYSAETILAKTLAVTLDMLIKAELQTKTQLDKYKKDQALADINNTEDASYPFLPCAEKFALERLVDKHNLEFYDLCEKISFNTTRLKANDATKTKTMEFLINYPLLNKLSFTKAESCLHLFVLLVNETQDQSTQKHFFGETLNFLKNHQYKHLKISLLRHISRASSSAIQEQFIEYLRQDLPVNRQHYPAAILVTLYTLGFALQDDVYLDAQCKAFLKYKHTEHGRTGLSAGRTASKENFIFKQPLVTAATMNLLWKNRDHNIESAVLQTLISTNFANKQNICAITDEMLVKLDILVAQLSALTTSARELNMISENTTEVTARASYLARHIQNTITAHSSPVRLLITGIHKNKSTIGCTACLGDQFFVSMRHNKAAKKFEVYIPTKTYGTMLFDDTLEDLNILARYLLNMYIEDAEDPQAAMYTLHALKIVSYSGYHAAPAILYRHYERRAQTPSNLHTPEFEAVTSPIIKAHSTGSLTSMSANPNDHENMLTKTYAKKQYINSDAPLGLALHVQELNANRTDSKLRVIPS